MVARRRRSSQKTVPERAAERGRARLDASVERRLTWQQAQALAGDPEMILEFAHYLARAAERELHCSVQVFADAFVSLNGRPSQRFVDPNVDLSRQAEGFRPKTWIVPLEPARTASTLTSSGN